MYNVSNPNRDGVRANCVQLCKKHHFGIDRPEKLASSPDDSKFLMKTLTQIKSNVAVPIKKKVMMVTVVISWFSSVFSSITFYLLFYVIFSSPPCPFFSSFPCFPYPPTAVYATVHHPPIHPPHPPLPTHPSLPNQYSPAFQAKENKERERMERRLLDELYKIFMDSDSFYYSMTYDLTNTVQRQGDSGKSDLPLWKQVGLRWTSRAHIYILHLGPTHTRQ